VAKQLSSYIASKVGNETVEIEDAEGKPYTFQKSDFVMLSPKAERQAGGQVRDVT